MSQGSRDGSELNFEAVEGFLQNEALSRFQVQFVPTHLFDWKPLSERLKDPSNLSDEEHDEHVSRSFSAGPSSSYSGGEEHSQFEKRRRELVSKLWDQLSTFYERQGYESLHALRSSLESREMKEREKVDAHRQRCEYFSALKAKLQKCESQHGEEAKVGMMPQKDVHSEDVEWSCPQDNPDRADQVQVKLRGSILRNLGLDPEVLQPHPWDIGSDEDLEGAVRKVTARLRREKKQVLERGDTLHLIRLRLQLLGRKLWLIDMGVSHDIPPDPYDIPAEIRNKREAIRYCLMILSVMGQIEEEWPSQSALGELLEENFAFDDFPLKPKSSASRAAEFIKQHCSEHYEDFRPDFYHELKIRWNYLQYVAEELDIEVPEKKEKEG